jgi:thymidylate kinase
MMRGRWVMIDGVGPGIGKSTLAENLAAELTTRGIPVDLIPEDALFTRPEFTEAATGFRTSQYLVEQTALPAAYSALVERSRATGAWVVFDWSAASMAEDLPWAEDINALTDHLRHVHEVVADLDPIVLLLDGDRDAALDRAVAQRGQDWLERRVKLAGDEDAPLRERAHHAQRLRDERVRRALAAAGWRLESVDGMLAPQEVVSHALRVLGLSRW